MGAAMMCASALCVRVWPVLLCRIVSAAPSVRRCARLSPGEEWDMQLIRRYWNWNALFFCCKVERPYDANVIDANVALLR